MIICRACQAIPDPLKNGVVVLGNFDGVHLGHQSVIGTALHQGRQQNMPVTVITFEPHPRQFFQPDTAPFRLTPHATKMRFLEKLGVDGVYILDFDTDLASLSHQQFIDDILVTAMKARQVVVGYDFCFGAGRQGTAETIRNGAEIDVTVIAPISSQNQQSNLLSNSLSKQNEDIYSSTRIRHALRHGNPVEASAMMGHPYEIEGIVLRGDKVGRTLGFPTANLDLNDYLRPKYGVYAVRAGLVNDQTSATDWYDAIANIGIRPTVDGLSERFETFIFDFAQDIYDRRLRVAFIDFIRPEMKMENLEALKKQIAADVKHVRTRLNQSPSSNITPSP